MGIESPIYRSSEVNRAAGMVAAQADCRIEQAFALMASCADESHVTVDDIAAAVLDRSIRFDD